MRVDFKDYDLSEFVITEGVFCSVPAKHIIPSDLGCKFTQKNKIFRSSIWSLDGELLSASFPKFVNWGENPENFPLPKNLDQCNFITKIDGSTMIVDYMNDQLNMRTRGTFNYSTLANPQDFDLMLKRYPKIKDYVCSWDNYSLLFEIVTPNQRIVINYGDEPDVYLIGIVNKNNYELIEQDLLDVVAKDMGIKRPAYFQFPSFEEMLKSIEENKDIEGVCVYSKDDQEIHKCKTARYLALHRLKSQLASLDKVIDLYLLQKRPTYKDFYDLILKTFDHEIAEMSNPNIQKCCMLGIWSQKVLDEIQQFVSNLDKSSRKDCALKIIAQYKEAGLDSFAFLFLTGKPIQDKEFKKLMEKLDT